MRFIFLLLLIGFPIAEITVLIKLFNQYGWWMFFYLVVVFLLGLQLIKEEKLLFSGRMMQGLTQGNSPFKALFGSARNFIAGIFLMIPGVITDVLAALLLLIPVAKAPTANNNHSFADDAEFQHEPRHANTKNHNKNPDEYDIIEGEYHRED